MLSDAVHSEEWRPVVGYDGYYEVSSQGRVRSLDRLVTFGTRQRQVIGRVLKPGKTIHGVYFVNLSVDGLKQLSRVHRMVLEAFVGPCPEGMEGCHYNDDKSDNRLVNLRWDTHSANMHDRTRNGGCHQAMKTQCPSGHEYSAENTKRDKNGGRFCRQCHRVDGREKYWRDIDNQRRIKREAQRRRRQRLQEQAA